MSDAEDGSDEGSESEDEETPKKKVPASLLLGIMLNHFFVLLPALPIIMAFVFVQVEPGKKRPTESATKTPVPAKKAKLVSPQNTGDLQCL